LPNVSAGEWASIDAICDEDIDFSDIPQQNVSQFVPYTERHQLKPMTIEITLDADIVDWLRYNGQDIQAQINTTLHQAMKHTG
jgi:uncharacterized protein (DUF4415 family)